MLLVDIDGKRRIFHRRFVFFGCERSLEHAVADILLGQRAVFLECHRRLDQKVQHLLCDLGLLLQHLLGHHQRPHRHTNGRVVGLVQLLPDAARNRDGRLRLALADRVDEARCQRLVQFRIAEQQDFDVLARLVRPRQPGLIERG